MMVLRGIWTGSRDLLGDPCSHRGRMGSTRRAPARGAPAGEAGAPPGDASTVTLRDQST